MITEEFRIPTKIPESWNKDTSQVQMQNISPFDFDCGKDGLKF